MVVRVEASGIVKTDIGAVYRLRRSFPPAEPVRFSYLQLARDGVVV